MQMVPIAINSHAYRPVPPIDDYARRHFLVTAQEAVKARTLLMRSKHFTVIAPNTRYNAHFIAPICICVYTRYVYIYMCAWSDHEQLGS